MKSACFSFNKASLKTWWVVRGIVRISKGLGGLVVGFDVEDSFVLEPFTFVHYMPKNGLR